MHQAISEKPEETAIAVTGAHFTADVSGAIYWHDERMLVVSDLHLEKGSSYAGRGVLLPPYDTAATLAQLGAAIMRHQPRTVIALGDSFHDCGGPDRLSDGNKQSLAALQVGRDWIWVTGNHDPQLPRNIGGVVAAELAVGSLTFRHEPTGARGEIAGHLHPKARVSGRGRMVERRCFVGDGERMVMPAFGAYAGGLNIRDVAFSAVFASANVTAHVLGRWKVHSISGSRCC